MPIEFDVLRHRDLTCVRLVGSVDISDILTYLVAYKAHPNYRPGLNEFLDLSAWTKTNMGYQDMRTMRHAEREMYPSKSPKTRCGIYAPSDLQYGMARIYASLTEIQGDIDTAVFEDVDQTLDFLSIDETDLEFELAQERATFCKLSTHQKTAS
ncbi:MAG: hypothetical protein ACRBB0_01535 [Pelagimonas sp.]|uniref:hypothetical protein n=1 Tax=Pelagimonas sp. TaxID=2073170 RepID=UPI003D6C63C7